MTMLPWAASKMISHRRPVLYAAVLAFLTTFGGSAAFSATAPHSDSGANSFHVSNGAARQFVDDARKAYARGDVKLGLNLLKNAVKVAPKDGTVRTLLARGLLRAGDPVSAERELRQALHDGGPEGFVLPNLFDAMMARHEEKKLLDEFPEPAAGDQGTRAAEIFKGRAMALLALGRAADAATAMDRSLALRRDVLGLIARAQIALKQNNIPLAAKLTDEAIKLEPDNGHAMSAKLLVLRLSNDNVGALALSERILRQFPNDIFARLTRIEVFLKLNQIEKARADVDFLLTRFPRLDNAVYYKAVILARTNDNKAAWRVAQSLPPDFVKAKPAYAIQVAQIAIKVGNVETGAAILAAALAYSPGQLDLRLRLAALRISQKSPYAALGVLLPIKDTRDPRVLTMLAQVYESVGKKSEAGAALDTLGSVKLQMKDTKGALGALTHAHGLLPNDGEITFHLVQALDANGDRNTAKGLLKDLLKSGMSFDDLPKARQLAAAWH